MAEIDEIERSIEQWDPQFRNLFQHAQQVSKWTLAECSDLPSWNHPTKKITLLGDSAHAMLPYLAQGAAQAIEDATFLAELLCHLDSKTQISDIVSLYERFRKPRTMHVKERNSATRKINGMLDGPAQKRT